MGPRNPVRERSDGMKPMDALICLGVLALLLLLVVGLRLWG